VGGVCIEAVGLGRGVRCRSRAGLGDGQDGIFGRRQIVLGWSAGMDMHKDGVCGPAGGMRRATAPTRYGRLLKPWTR